MTTNEMTMLVSRAMNRDNDAMERLYRECYEDVYFVCKKYSLNDADANDITQDTFIQAFEKLSTLDNGAKFKAWITRIATNKCLDMLKHNKVLTIDSMYDENDEIIDIPDVSKATEDIIVDNEVKETLVGMMEKLPVEQRVTLFMYYYQNYSIKEIAIAYGCSENTVKSRLNYAKKTMRAEAEKLEDKGIKLRVVAILPFLYVIFQSERAAFACQVPDCTTLLSQVMGSFVASGTTATNAGSAAVNGMNMESNMNISGGVGAVSKAGVAKGLWIKIAAGLIGTVAVVGSVIAVITLGGDDNSEGISTNTTSIVSENTTNGNEDTTSDKDKETTTQDKTESNKELAEFMERYKEYVDKQVECNLFGALSLYCNNKAKGTVEQIMSLNCNRYNSFSAGTLTMGKTYEMESQYNKFVSYGADGQLYLYEKKERPYVDGKGNQISSLSYNKYTRTPVEKFNMGQVWLDFINGVISSKTVRDIGKRDVTESNMYFTVTLSGTELVEVLDYTSVIEQINDYLQYSTDKKFEDYTYNVKIIMTINDFYNNEIMATSDELVEDLIKAYAKKNASGNADNYTLSEDESHYWQQLRMKFQFFDYEHEDYYYYPCYIDVEAAGNNLLINLYDQKEPYYVLLPQDIPGYDFYATDIFNTKFVGTSDGDVTKRIIIDDKIGISGKYGMDMAGDAFKFINCTTTPSKDFVVNSTIIGGKNVHYIIDKGVLNDSEKTDNAIILFAYVELDVSEANGDVGHVAVVIEYTGKDSVPATDGMVETLAHIVENMEYVGIDDHFMSVK